MSKEKSVYVHKKVKSVCVHIHIENWHCKDLASPFELQLIGTSTTDFPGSFVLSSVWEHSVHLCLCYVLALDKISTLLFYSKHNFWYYLTGSPCVIVWLVCCSWCAKTVLWGIFMECRAYGNRSVIQVCYVDVNSEKKVLWKFVSVRNQS